MKIDNSPESRLSILLCALAAIVPFLWHQGSLTAPVIYKQMAIETVSIFLAAFCLFLYVKKKQTFTLKLPVMIWPVIAFHAVAAISVLLAAKRLGISEVMLPAANAVDVDELPDSVCDGLNIHYAKHFRDVAKLMFGIRMKPAK